MFDQFCASIHTAKAGGLRFVFFSVILLIKKRNQLGKTWSGQFVAKIKVYDNYLKCHACNYDHFSKREGLLNTTFLTLFSLGQFNRSATCYICSRCGHIHWFNNKNQDIEINASKKVKSWSKETLLR